jgi:hypothetical protein
LIQKEEHKLNKSKSEEVVPRYRSVSFPYCWNGQENEELKQRAQIFEPTIRYIIEQEVATQGIRMSRGVELALVIKQEIIVLLKT